MTLFRRPTGTHPAPSAPAGEATGAVNPRLLDDLASAYRPGPPPARLDAAVTLALREHAPVTAAERRRPRPRMLAATAALCAALALLAAGGTGALHLAGPAPASAQTILHRAAAAMHLAPDQAAHLVYTLSVAGPGASAKAKDGRTGTVDVWVQAGADGTPDRVAQALTMPKAGFSRYVQVGAQVYAYNPEMRGDDTIMLGSGRGTAAWAVPPAAFDGASVATQLAALAQHSPQQVVLLPQQTLDGAAVDVIEVNGWMNRPAQRTIFYIDAQSYVLRGFDAASADPAYPTPSWQARLTSSATVDGAAVPADAFALQAPATARLQRPDLGSSSALAALTAALAAACHAPLNLKQVHVSGQSVLAACQATASDMTAATLAAALAAPDQAALAAGVTAGVLPSSQASSLLSAAQAWFTTWVGAPLAAGPAPTPGPAARK